MARSAPGSVLPATGHGSHRPPRPPHVAASYRQAVAGGLRHLPSQLVPEPDSFNPGKLRQALPTFSETPGKALKKNGPRLRLAGRTRRSDPELSGAFRACLRDSCGRLNVRNPSPPRARTGRRPHCAHLSVHSPAVYRGTPGSTSRARLSVRNRRPVLSRWLKVQVLLRQQTTSRANCDKTRQAETADEFSRAPESGRSRFPIRMRTTAVQTE